ncbi:hypothetical protein [uncultured Vagococcus sp.]|uniref:hypothetical protein n=1 Tax=uncultured Vagococcus sp. TaxID=189676 RepID=UPI0028D0801E|nr:hypothetical protein [uncultured Vagococcus sp.]
MNKLSRILFKHSSSIRKWSNWTLYIIFSAYILYLVFTTPQPLKIVYGMIGLVVLSIILLFEWLKSLYDRMILALTFDCNQEKARQLRDQLIKFDYFHGFAPSLKLFDTLLLLDQGAFQECLSHLDKHHRFFHGTKDYLLINYHTQMQCAYYLNNRELFDDSLKKLSQLKYSLQTKKDLSPLYSWEEIDGLHFLRDKRYSQALKKLEGVDTTNFNPRETTYLLFEKAQVNHALNKSSEAHRLLKDVIAQGNQLHLVELAKRKEWITFEEHQ